RSGPQGWPSSSSVLLRYDADNWVAMSRPSLEIQADDRGPVLDAQHEALERAEPLEPLGILGQHLGRWLHADDQIHRVAAERHDKPRLGHQRPGAEQAERRELAKLVGGNARRLGH